MKMGVGVIGVGATLFFGLAVVGCHSSVVKEQSDRVVDKSKHDKLREASEALDRGDRAFGKGNNEEAIAEYTEAIRLNPEYGLAYGSRAVVYSSKRDHDKAIADYTEAIRLDPKDAQAYCNRAVEHSSKKNYDEAIADYTKAIRLNPKYGLAYYNRANTYRE